MKKDLKLKKQYNTPAKGKVKPEEVRKLFTGEFMWALPTTGLMVSHSLQFVKDFFKVRRMEFTIKELNWIESRKYYEFL